MPASSKQAQLVSKNYIVVFVLITLLVVGITFLIGKALVTSIVRDNKVVSAKTTANRQLKANLVAAPELVDSFSALGSEAGVLSDALPDTADFPSLIVALENMTNDSGMTLKSVAPLNTAVVSVPATSSSAGTTTSSAKGSTASGADPTVASPPSPYEFSISISGTYGGLQKLLSEIETSARPMRVVGVQVTGASSSMTGELDVETFYQAKAQWPFGSEVIK